MSDSPVGAYRLMDLRQCGQAFGNTLWSFYEIDTTVGDDVSGQIRLQGGVHSLSQGSAAPGFNRSRAHDAIAIHSRQYDGNSINRSFLGQRSKEQVDRSVTEAFAESSSGHAQHVLCNGEVGTRRDDEEAIGLD